jgi:hypothetical protein
MYKHRNDHKPLYYRYLSKTKTYTEARYYTYMYILYKTSAKEVKFEMGDAFTKHRQNNARKILPRESYGPLYGSLIGCSILKTQKHEYKTFIPVLIVLYYVSM